DAVPVVLVHLHRVEVRVHAGVVDETVQPAERADRVGDRAVHLLGHAHVASEEVRLPALREARGDLLPGRVDVEQGNDPVRLDDRLGDGGADPAGRPRDEYGPAREGAHAKVSARSRSSQNGGRYAHVPEIGSTSSARAMPSWSCTNARRAEMRDHKSGCRAAISARSVESGTATGAPQVTVQPGPMPVRVMSLCSTMPLAIGSSEPARIGESSHSS